MATRLFAIVLTWNDYRKTSACIASLRRGALKPERIIVVDNGSADGSFERLRDGFIGRSDLQFVRNSSNLGFARGVNVGIHLALEQGAELVFLVNNDIVMESDTIGTLVREAEKDVSVGIVGPMILYFDDPKRIWQGGGYFSRLRAGVVVPAKNQFVRNHAPEEKSSTVTFLTGCAMLVRRTVFETIGYFDERYFLYVEDLDFCLTASGAGFTLLYVPSARVWHKIGRIATTRTSPLVLYNMARSRVLFLKKNFSWCYALYGIFVHLVIYTPFRFLQVLQGSRCLVSGFAWLRGTWDGLRDSPSRTGQAFKEH